MIELLVVVAIIAVLLALLVPAIERAIGRAELTTCAARQHGLLTVFNGYAVERQRKYPSGQVPDSTYEATIFTSHDFVRVVEAYTGNNKAATFDNGDVQLGVVPEMLVDTAFKDFGYRDNPNKRYVIGYQYLGGHPALNGPNPGFESPMSLGKQGTRELVACINIWSVGAVPPVAGIRVGPFTISAHTVNGPTGRLENTTSSQSYFDYTGPNAGGDPKQFHEALGGNMGYADGSAAWKDINKMELRFSGTGPGSTPASENYNPGYW